MRLIIQYRTNILPVLILSPKDPIKREPDHDCKIPNVLAMSAKVIAFSAIVATASAFAPTTGMVPRLRTGAASVNMAMDKSARAPVITVFDHRGCNRAPKEYRGKAAGNKNDEMMVKAQSVKILADEAGAAGVLQSVISTLKK
eukprot:1810742-Rhodomonas_salina.2